MKGHSYFGYKGNGEYRCECGYLLSRAGLIKYGNDPHAPEPVGVRALKEQWEAHKKEASRNAP